jgi:hypothetical protein
MKAHSRLDDWKETTGLPCIINADHDREWQAYKTKKIRCRDNPAEWWKIAKFFLGIKIPSPLPSDGKSTVSSNSLPEKYVEADKPAHQAHLSYFSRFADHYSCLSLFADDRKAAVAEPARDVAREAREKAEFLAGYPQDDTVAPFVLASGMDNAVAWSSADETLYNDGQPQSLKRKAAESSVGNHADLVDLSHVGTHHSQTYKDIRNRHCEDAYVDPGDLGWLAELDFGEGEE